MWAVVQEEGGSLAHWTEALNSRLEPSEPSRWAVPLRWEKDGIPPIGVPCGLVLFRSTLPPLSILVGTSSSALARVWTTISRNQLPRMFGQDSAELRCYGTRSIHHGYSKSSNARV
jgi:hypothetical protein